MKSNYTFVALKFKQAVATALSLAVFLCLIGYFDTEKWCRNYHNCLNTISPCLGLSNGKYDTIFFVVQNTQIKQMLTNANSQILVNAPELSQEVIGNLFATYGLDFVPKLNAHIGAMFQSFSGNMPNFEQRLLHTYAMILVGHSLTVHLQGNMPIAFDDPTLLANLFKPQAVCKS
jgi:hypothetical protein